MKLNRKWMLLVALVLSVAMATTGTLAYLTDEDKDVNTMTLGKVEIVQNEQERTDHGLDEFTQDKPLYPAVYEGTSIPWADENDWVEPGNQAWKVVEDNANVVDKFVTVTNIGKSNAYVRTIIAYEGDETYGPEGAYIHIVHNGDNVNPVIEVEELGVMNIGGVDYTVYSYTYPEVLVPDQTTIPSLKQVYMDKSADNDVVAQYGEKYDILVLSQAVQAKGFEGLGEANGTTDAKYALNEAFGEVTAEKLNEWLAETEIGSPNGDKNMDNNPPYPPVSTADELVAALEAGKDVKLMNNIKIDPASMSNAYGTTGINVKNGQSIDGNGYTIDIKGAGGTWDSGINTTGGLIKNLTVTGSFRGIFINHNSDHSEPVVLKNVTIDGTTYTISCDQGMNQTFEATDSTFNGWTSYAATLGSAKFVNCKFGEGNGYAYCRPYAPTEFVGCEFEAGYVVDPRAAVTFENCTIGGEPLTAENLDELVSNPANATVK